MANPHQSQVRTATMGGDKPHASAEKKSTAVELRQDLAAAQNRTHNIQQRFKANKAAIVDTGMLVVHTAETQASLFAASFAEGYLGSDRLKIGSVDLRAPVALLAQGYGLYEALMGSKSGAGAHALSVGNGVMGSFLASVAVGAGKLLAQKQAAQANPPPSSPPAPADAPVDGIPDPALRGTREVLLTPEVDLEGNHRPRRRRPARRFFDRDRAPKPHLRRDHDEDDDTDERS